MPQHPAPPQPPNRRSFGRLALLLYGALIVFGIILVAVFAFTDRSNEGYKWLLALGIFVSAAFYVSLMSGVLAMISAARREPRYPVSIGVILISMLIIWKTRDAALLIPKLIPKLILAVIQVHFSS